MPKPKGVIGFRNALDRLFSPIILFFSKLGVTANHITFLQAPFTIIMFWFLVKHNFALAAASLGITLLLDVLDGSWARVTNSITEKGHKYDKAMDLFGIYAFLVGISFAKHELILLVIALGAVNAILYGSNEFIKPELYCGVRTFGFLGLLVFVKHLSLCLQLSLLLGIIMLAIKLFKFQAQRRLAGGRKAAKAKQKRT